MHRLVRPLFVMVFLFFAARYYDENHAALDRHGLLLKEGDPWLQIVLVIVSFLFGLGLFGAGCKKGEHEGRALGFVAAGCVIMLLSFHWLRS